MKTKYSILTIDGGGLRAAATCQVLIALEERLQGRVADYFTMIGGTSTGGLLTALLTHPKKYTAKDCSELYLEYASTIFNPSLWRTIQSVFFGAKYSADGLEKCLYKYLGSTRLSELTNLCIIPAYDIINRKTKFFVQDDYKKYGNSGDFYIKDVCRATSAAETYFSPARIRSINGENYTLIDGGNSCNNVTLCALTEIMDRPDKPKLEDIFILSLGTGSVEKPYYNSWKYGMLNWIKPALDIMMSASSEIVDFHLQQLYESVNRPDLYERIQLNSLKNVSPEMDDSKPSNMIELVKLGKQTANRNKKALDDVAKKVLSL